MSAPDIAVRVDNVSKVYRIYEKPEHRLVQMATLGRVRRFTEFSALKDVSLEIRRGETVGIVGRNGCGKSTLLQIICGTLQPSSGHVEVNGRVAALLELGAGFNGEFTGRENVYMNGAILGFSREEMDARFDQIAAFAGIGDFIERPVKTYSSGMFVRLAFAVATAVEPDILIIDEALAVGDEAFQRKCFARIEAIKERGGTILFVSHGAQSVVQLCDRAVLLDAGEKLLEGKPRALTNCYSRLLSMDPNEASLFRDELRDLNFLDDASTTAISNEPPVNGTLATPLPAKDPSDWYDPNLAQPTETRYQNRGAHLKNLRIESLDASRINMISTGLRYRVAYEVAFDLEARQIALGFMISTSTGFKLVGVGTSKSQRYQIDHILPGQTVQVSFEFDCRLSPGTYFLSAGVSSETINGREYLDRVLDGVIFKVNPMQESILTAYLDLSVTPAFKICSSASTTR